MSQTDPPHKAWLAKADNDLLNIRNNLDAAEIPWDTVCFHAQQAAEKLLKGFLVWKEQDLVRTHDLVALLARSVVIDPSLADLEADCRELTYYAVSSRYPDALYEADENDGRRMIAAVERIRAAILARLPAEKPQDPGSQSPGGDAPSD
jgi:HEPN domain-containing protein